MNSDPMTVQCPYCGEMIEIQIDPSAGEQSYIEDCSVCCRPIEFAITPGDEASGDEPEVTASRSD